MSRPFIGLKKCRRCGERSPFPSEFNVTRNGTPSMYCTHCDPIYRYCQGCGKRCRTPQQIGPRGKKCVDCKRAAKKARDKIYYVEHRDETIARANAWNKANPERHKQHLNKHWQGLRADPVRHIEYVVRKRMSRRGNGHAKGVLVKQRGTVEPWTAPYEANHTAPIVDAEPLADWLRYEFGSWSVTELARYVGVDDSHLAKIVAGKQEKISLHIADRIFVGADCTHLLGLLYPETADAA